MKVKILLADDHPLVRAGIRATLATVPEFTLVGEACNGEEVQRMSLDLQPDVLLLDLSMPGPPAEETIPRLKAAMEGIKIII